MPDLMKTLPEALQGFVLQWGDMGGHWGVNRSIAQIHALLFLSDQPLSAEDIASSLGIARSNVSTSLRELVSWRLIQRVPVQGDRRDHFVAETDVWEVSLRIAEGRKRREIDPARQTLIDCVQAAEKDPRVTPVALARLKDMLAFVESANRWYSDILTIPRAQLRRLMKLGRGVTRVLGGDRSGRNK